MRPSSPHDAKASVARPYTLSKKSRYLVTLQFSLTSNFRFSRIKPKRCIAPRGAGGGRRIRTDGILLAKQALYQLSYTPVPPGGVLRRAAREGLVGLTRVELVTSSLSGTRSNQLSYKPLVFGRDAEHLSRTESPASCFNFAHRRASPQKGGDPTAGSPTVTLLRLHPNHHPHLRLT